jgi:hypothetical protein
MKCWDSAAPRPSLQSEVVGWVGKPSKIDFNHRWVSFLNPAYRAASDVGCAEQSKAHRSRRASDSRTMRFVPQRILRPCWEHAIRDERDYQRHVDYIHYNPVKHGYVNTPHKWPHSSFMRWVDRGMYPMNWAAPPDIIDM